MSHDHAPHSPDIFYIQSARKQRAERVGKIQHLGAAAMLILAGWTHISGGHAEHSTTNAASHAGGALTLLAYAEIGAGALLVASVMVERVRHSQGKHSSIGWVEIFGALMTLVEAIVRLYEPHTTAFRIASFAPPIVLFVVGLFQVRMARRYYLRVHDGAFESKQRFKRRKRVPLQTITRYRLDRDTLLLEHHDGAKTSVPLKDISNREDALQWIAQRLQNHGVKSGA
jgi:hypothetical protein